MGISATLEPRLLALPSALRFLSPVIVSLNHLSFFVAVVVVVVVTLTMK